MDYPEWVTDDTRSDVDTYMNVIHDAHRASRLGVMIGAGASVPGNAPSTSSLVEAAFNEYLYSASALDKSGKEWQSLLATPFELVMSALQVQIKDREVLEDWFRRKIYLRAGLPLDPDSAYSELASVVNGGNQLRRIFTTNFDNMIERSIGARAKVITSANSHQLQAFESTTTNVSVIHFHGLISPDADSPSSTFVATEETMMSTLDDTQTLQWSLVETLVGSTAFVFVGYSLSDSNVRLIYSRFRNILKSKDRKIPVYFVTGGRSQHRFKIDRQMAESRDAKVLPVTLQAFFRDLRLRTERASARELRETISLRLRGSASDYDVLADLLRDEFGFTDEAITEFLKKAPNRNGRRT